MAGRETDRILAGDFNISADGGKYGELTGAMDKYGAKDLVRSLGVKNPYTNDKGSALA